MLKYRSASENTDRVFHALADPSRRVIVERLSRGSASVSELPRPLSMSLPAALRPAEQWIGARRLNCERRLDRLGDYLAERDDEPPKAGTR